MKLRPLLCLVASSITTAAPAPARLKVSDDKHHLVTADGQPFFWLGNTAWELLHRLNREDAEHCLKQRAADTHREIIRRMALGLHKGDGCAHRSTFHPTGGHDSSQYFQDSPWLDFNMRQNGHVAELTGRYSTTRDDYDAPG